MRTAPDPGPEQASAWALRDRLAWLARFERRVLDGAETLCEAISLDVHKPHHEAYTSEVMALLASSRWHRRRAARLLAPQRVGGGPVWMLGTRVRLHRAPLGTVGIIATWNYPVQLLGVQLVQALLAGNRVIVKPSERSPVSQPLLLEMAQHAGLPPGQLRWTEPTRQAGPALLREGTLDHLIFTGSTSVGREVARWAAQHLVSTTLELSGSDSALVLDDADVKLAARVIWSALTMNAGQTCLAPRRVLVTPGAYRGLCSALAYHAAAARPLRLIDEAAARRCWELARDALDRGARSLSGVSEPNQGDRLRALVLADCPADAPIVRGEHFGCVLPVVLVGSPDEAIALHRRVPQRLSVSVFTRRVRWARSLGATLGAGNVYINDAVYPAGHPGVGIAGTGPSGWGVTRGGEGLLALTRPVYVTSTGFPRVPTGELTPARLAGLKRFVSMVYGSVDRSRGSLL